AEFAVAELPDWVTDWLARRRPRAATKPAEGAASMAALAESEASAPDAKAEARAGEQRQRVRAQREAAVANGLDEMDRWIGDQLDRGLAAFPAGAAAQCRIASQRLVDAKAPGLALRLDGLAAELFAVPEAARPRFILERLAQAYLIGQAYRRQAELPDALRADVRRAVGWTQNREEILADPATLQVEAAWRVVGVSTEVQADRLRRLETWLMRASGEGPEFALLLDFVPAGSGAA